MSGQGVVLARLPLVGESIERGELVEPFGSAGRMASPFAYWLIEFQSGQAARPEVALFARWLVVQAAQTRQTADIGVNAAPA